jgi:formylglycine-generating enzyme required for sulfatase activity
VASLRPNPNGLYDMHGNVWEWVQDWYDAARPGGTVNPTGPAQGSARVVRGGSWVDGPQFLRSARRSGNRPGIRISNIGFRLVRTLK